jgi:hypothetical protein
VLLALGKATEGPQTVVCMRGPSPRRAWHKDMEGRAKGKGSQAASESGLKTGVLARAKALGGQE